MNPPNSVSSSLDVQSKSETTPSIVAADPSGSVGFHLFSFILGALMATIFLGGSLFLLRKPDPPPIVLQPPPTPLPTGTPMPTPTPAPMTVFVSGAVTFPGLYLLESDARVGDAIESAGGLTSDADAVIVNQAEKLWDGAQVHVPVIASSGNLASDGSPTVDEVASRFSEPPAGVSGLAGAIAPATGAIGGSAGQGIDINAGSLAELETLPGIGASKAQAIVDSRPYATVDELERVPGIGPKTVEQLRELVVVK
jgi:competence protein ComEA